MAENRFKYWMKIYFALQLCAVFFLGGCATTGRLVNYKSKMIDIPEIGKVMKVEIGDTIINKAEFYSIPAIILDKEFEIVPLGSVPPQRLILKTETDDLLFYWGEKGVYFLGKLLPGGICISTSDNEMKSFLGRNGAKGRFKQQPNVKHIDIPDPNKPSFNQELIYNGRIQNGVKFLYREFSKDMIRAPFSQEIQYDLAESKNIGFKGARIEIIEATNNYITYIVRNSFSK
jgi:hypothetical protein